MTQFNWINYFERLLAKSSLRDTCAELCLLNIFKTQQGGAWWKKTKICLPSFVLLNYLMNGRLRELIFKRRYECPSLLLLNGAGGWV